MKLIQTTRDELLKPLQAVSGIVERRHTLPILSNVLLESSGNRVSLVATDLEISVTTSFPHSKKNDESSSVTVSARKLLDILRSLPEGAEISVEIQNNKLLLRSAKSRFQLQTLPVEEFPRMTVSETRTGHVKLDQKILLALLLKVQYAMAQQDIRYYLNGMLLVMENNLLRAVATDGHRLAYASISHESSVETREVILPRKTVVELVKLLGEGEITLEFGANQVAATMGDIQLVTKVVEGKFPDFNRVIPSNYKKSFRIARLTLLQALQRVAILSNEKFRGVRWTLTRGQLKISCTNTEQEEAFEEMDVAYEGDALDIGFNVSYLLDVLNNLQVSEVTCSFGDANSSVLITIAEDKDFRYVVMPMRI